MANLATAWSGLGARMLALDFDPQFALTRGFGLAPSEAPATVVELLAGERELGEAVARDVVPGVDLLASRRKLANLGLSLVTELKREQFLARTLADAAGYDVVLTDCPPNLALLTVNALFAVGEVLVPASMLDGGAFQGAGEVLATIRRLADRGVALEVAALVRTLVDRRRVSYQAISDALSELDAPLATAEIRSAPTSTRRSSTAARSPRCGRTAPARLPTVAWPRSSPQRRPARVFGGPHSGDRSPAPLKMVDDPLAPARTPPQREPDAEEDGAAEEQPRPSARRAAKRPLQGIFGRVPPELARRLEGMVFELKAERARVSQQDVLAALLWRYVDHTDPASVRPSTSCSTSMRPRPKSAQPAALTVTRGRRGLGARSAARRARARRLPAGTARASRRP